MTVDSLVAELLAKPIGPARAAKPKDDADFSRQIEVDGNTAAVTLRGAAVDVDESAASAFLRTKGEDPELWEPTGFRSSEWTMLNGEIGVSTRYVFRRRAGTDAIERPPIDELVNALKPYRARAHRPEGEHGVIVALGDMQFGKIDGDGVDGTVRRVIDNLDRAADITARLHERYDIGHVHLAWLGDHVEGFSSQGGANVWRTALTMAEQIRLTRRVMLYGLTDFAHMASEVSLAAVPGNHGEPQRFSGKGVTRYDDSNDTESLIAVADAAELAGKFEHVKFYVPETDEMTVTLDVAGTVVAHVHGHQWRPGKHFEWWEGQAFHNAGLQQADVLLAGHLHHLLVEANGPRMFVQVPSLESESTWYRHSTGTTGDPGLVVAVVKSGRVVALEVVR